MERTQEVKTLLDETTKIKDAENNKDKMDEEVTDLSLERNNLKTVIYNALNELPQKEKCVLVLYYLEDATFKEIGTVLGVSKSCVLQLHFSATKRLRAKLAKQNHIIKIAKTVQSTIQK